MCKNERVFDESIELKNNAMLRHKPELFYQWNFEKNDELGLDVYKVTQGVNKKAWWICLKCESDYEAVINNRTRGSSCPYCNGKSVNHTNSLFKVLPDLAKEWHPSKNGKITPRDVSLGVVSGVWWMCEKKHEWKVTIAVRIGGAGCPYCSNPPRKLLVGFNDIWTTNTTLASLLANPEDGYKYTQTSSEKVDWKCKDCGGVAMRKAIGLVNTHGLSCSRCGDGTSFPEKIMYNLLKENKIEFEFDTVRKWSQNRRYDFYLPEYNWIIEVHGIQHYESSFERIGGRARTLIDEQENDRLKEKLANENGISNYIVIDARESTVEWIKRSVLNSDVTKLAPIIDFAKIGRLASNSLVKNACDLWNSGIYNNAAEIAELMNLGRNTITRYLKRGAEIGWCEFPSKRQPIVQISLDQTFLKEWGNIQEASSVLNIRVSNIRRACRDKQRSFTAGGYFWLYKADYDSLKDKIQWVGTALKTKKCQAIVQLDQSSKLLKEWSSITNATKALNIHHASVSAVCRGVNKTAGGFKWMYKEDYDEYIISQSDAQDEVSNRVV